jgi:uncharacterized integral membrane protein (TIGR00698 family)
VLTWRTGLARLPVQTGLSRLLPGLGLAVLLTVLAALIAGVEERLVGAAVLEPIVLTLLLGVLIRNVFPRATLLNPGAGVAAKQVLEVGVALLGLTVDARALLAAGPVLPGLVVGGVGASLFVSFGIGRVLGLPLRLAILVAAGNSICGNSAIAAAAPAIGARREEVASAIALTAVLGLAVVLLLPLAIVPLGLDHYQYGVLAGMSVYAVPQVLAATLPVSQISAEVGTLVKLLRVLLLGPVILLLGLLFQHKAARGSAVRPSGATRYVPWFVAAFLVLAAIRGVIDLPDGLVAGAGLGSRWLTVLAMAGLGFGVELSAVRRVGARVGMAVIGSLGFLIAFSLSAIVLLGIHG